MRVQEREMRSRRAAKVAEARKLLDTAEAANRDLTPDEKRRYDALVSEVEDLGKAIERRDWLRAAEEEDRTLQPRVVGPAGGFPLGAEQIEDADPADNGRGHAYRARDGREYRALRPNESLTSRAGSGLPDGIRPDELDLGRALRAMVSGDWRGAEAEQRALSTGVDASGGYMVPDALSSRVIDLARNNARVIRAGAETLPMETNSLDLARVEGDVTSEYHAENAAITATDLTLGRVTLTPRTIATLTPVSIELMEDAANLAQVVESSMVSAMSLQLDYGALRGAGAPNEILGIRTTSGVQLLDLSQGSIDHDDFSTAVENVLNANAMPERLSAIYSAKTAGALERLKDTQGRYLEGPQSYRDLRKFVSNQIPNNLGTGTDESEVYLGDFSNVLIGMRTQIRVEVSREATDHATGLGFSTGTVLIRGYLRADVAIARPAELCVIHGFVLS